MASSRVSPAPRWMAIQRGVFGLRFGAHEVRRRATI